LSSEGRKSSSRRRFLSNFIIWKIFCSSYLWYHLKSISFLEM
jgi:hypothetical protein